MPRPRHYLSMAALLAAAPAQAWTWEEGPGVDLPAPVVGMTVVPHLDDRVQVLAFGAQVSWLVDVLSGRVLATLPVGGRDAVLLDVDGDGLRDLVLCGSAGLRFVNWEGSFKGVVQRLEDRRCSAVAVVDSADGPLLAAAGEDVRIYEAPGNGMLALREVLPVALVGAPLLAAEGELLAVSSVGATEILEWSQAGPTTLATGGPIGGLALGPWGWAWTLPERGALADMTHRLVPIDPRPGALVSGDLDRDGQRDMVVLHDGGLGTVLLGTTGGWERLRLHGRPTTLVVRDVDLDGCDDLVIGRTDPAGITLLRGDSCELPVALPGTFTPRARSVVDPDNQNRTAAPTIDPSWRPPPPLERPPRALGMALPPFLGAAATRSEEHERWQHHVIVGSGWAMGGALRNVFLQIPFFPALSVEMEVGGPHFRWFLGGDSAALFLWQTDTGGGIHLANLSTGFTFGGPRLRTGPYATAGLLNYGAGWRTVFTPWDDGETLKGIELRLNWFAPYTGEVMVLYVWSQPMGDRRRRARTRTVDAAPSVVATASSEVDEGMLLAVPLGAEDRVAAARAASAPPPPEPKELVARAPISSLHSENPRRAPALLSCSQMGLYAGVALGGSSTRFSWAYVGSDVPLSVSGSPSIAAMCETGGRGLGLLFSAETAPFYNYLTRDDDKLHQMGSHTFGVMLGGKGFRIGPTATAGIWTLGGGLRAAIKIREDKQGLLHNLDIRATAHWPSAPAGQLMVMYGLAWDSWKNGRRGDPSAPPRGRAR